MTSLNANLSTQNRANTVFYVDDEPELCEIFFELYSSAQVKIVTFANESSLIEALSNNVPDLVFLDYRLHDTTGVEIAAKLPKSLAKYLISGESFINSQGLFIDTLVKPVEESEIYKILEKHLQISVAA